MEESLMELRRFVNHILRLVQYGLLGNNSRALSDQALDQLVQDTVTQHPYVGHCFVWGVICSQGYQVTRARVREVFRRSDPIGIALRWGSTAISRQPHTVPGPNSLWHIDGNHKLICWRMVCHGGIDGFSRMIVFLKCSNNNRFNTVYELFLKGVDRFGLPSKVRSDYGGENYLVAMHMIRFRGQGRGSTFTGSTTHNQRIERINYSLKCFQDGWNHHGIRTARHPSPQQMFVEGFLRLRSSGLIAMDFFDRVDGNYGISDDDPLPEEHGSVTVSENCFYISANEIQSLQNEVNALKESNDYGVDLYFLTLEYLQTFDHT
uniref:Integrase catalytic domain-containing protein n=1 Tax=Amphimedon queenslandica TaxID=400682 RepID=A0A1X7TV74_AMPQE